MPLAGAFYSIVLFNSSLSNERYSNNVICFYTLAFHGQDMAIKGFFFSIIPVKSTIMAGYGDLCFLVPVLWKKKKVDLCEFKASLVYIENLGHPGLHDETLDKINYNNNKSLYWYFLCLKSKTVSTFLSFSNFIFPHLFFILFVALNLYCKSYWK